MGRVCASLLLSLLLGAGCGRTLSGQLVAPNPLVEGREAARSYDVVITTRDPDFGGGPMVGLDRDGRFASHIDPFRLRQIASLRVISPDEVRIDLILAAPWQELADIREFSTELEDDRGLHMAPSDRIARPGTSHTVRMEFRALRKYMDVRLRDGDRQPARRKEFWAYEPRVLERDLYRSLTTLVFRRPGLLRENTRSLLLHLKGPAHRELRFTWTFAPPRTAETGGRHVR
jgi:hypothetical protein